MRRRARGYVMAPRARACRKQQQAAIAGHDPLVFQAVELVRTEICPAQAVLPLVGLAADKITHHGYTTGITVFHGTEHGT
ncbi:MAG: hypothetical protein ACODAD_00535 [Planctomycetota bacterium]